MPRNARDILSFSDQWFRLVREVVDKGKVIKLPYTTDHEYRIIINEYYGFRKALKANAEFQDVYRKCGQIKTYREGKEIYFHHANTGKHAHLLLAALGPEEEQPLQVEPANDMGEKLEESDFVNNDSDTVILMEKYFRKEA